LEFNSIIKNIASDPLIITSMLLSVAIMGFSGQYLFQEYIPSKRIEIINKNYKKDLAKTSSEIDNLIKSIVTQLSAISEKQNVSQLMTDGDKALLDAALLVVKGQVLQSENLFLLDKNLATGVEALSPAALAFARNISDDGETRAKAIRVSGEWRLVISVPLIFQSEITGQFFLQQPINILNEILIGGDETQGTLFLEQIEDNRSVTRLSVIGEPTAKKSGTINFGQYYPLEFIEWRLKFNPSKELENIISESELPIWIIILSVIIIWLGSVLTLIKNRINHGNEAISIFTRQSKDVSTIRFPQGNPQKKDQAVKKEHNIKSDETTLTADNSQSERESHKQIVTDASDSHGKSNSAEGDKRALHDLDNETSAFVLPNLVFRDYDIRGLVENEITDEFALRLGKTLGSLVLRRGNNAIYIGRDGRNSSPHLSTIVCEGLLSTGCNVIDLGQIVTPALNFAVHYSGQSSCGIMVTASHNPANFNGFKIIVQGQVLAGNTLQLLKPIMNSQNYTEGRGEYFSRLVIPQYVRQIFEDIGLVREFKIVIDGANSVTGPVAVDLFESLGCRVVPLYCEIDGSFPNHDPNPSDEFNLIDLRARVKSEGADLGFAFDGDGDRLVVVTHEGDICWPDKLLMLFSQDILQQSPGSSIVFDVKCSNKLSALIRECNGEPIMCKTGHAHVRNALHEENAVLGGEFSGHIFFNDRRKGFDDGLYAAARLLQLLSTTYKSLHVLLAEFDSCAHTGEIRIPVAETSKFQLMREIEESCEFKGAKVQRLDGLRVEYPQGWGLIRASNTSGNLTLRFEAEDQNILGYIKQTFKYKLAPLIPNIEEYL